MAQKRKHDAHSNALAGTVRKVEPLGRGIEPPALLKQAPKTRAFRLQPKSKIHGPVDVWGYSTDDGWTGWLQERRNIQLKPTHWIKRDWIELPAREEKTG